jgi:hypothetical protein
MESEGAIALSSSLRLLALGREADEHNANAPHPLTLLRARRERPRGSGAAEQREELASS